jgi:hypothetical protein
MAKVIVRGGKPIDDFTRIVIKSTNGDEKSDPLIKLSASNDPTAFLKKALADNKQSVFKVVNADDRRALSYLIIAIISDIPDAKARAEIVKKFVTSPECKAIYAGGEVHSVLHMLFHTLQGMDDFVSLPHVLLALLKLGVETMNNDDREEKEGLSGLSASGEYGFEFQLDDVLGWLKQWKTPVPLGAEILDARVSYYQSLSSK